MAQNKTKKKTYTQNEKENKGYTKITIENVRYEQQKVNVVKKIHLKQKVFLIRNNYNINTINQS